MTGDLLPGNGSTDLLDSEAAYRERIRQLEERVTALTAAAAKREGQAAAEIAAHKTAYADRVGYLERQVAALTEAAIKREADAVAELQAYQAAYFDRITYLEAQIAALTKAAVEREARAVAQTAALTEAANERETRTTVEIAALTDAAIEREKQLQQRGETDYQLLMTHQNMLAEFKDLDPEFHDLYERCRPFTMTSIERLYALYRSVEYVCASKLEGDLAECGVWQGGSCMLMALALMRHRSMTRRIWMFDTYAGHPQPDGERDIDLWGNRAIDEWRRHQADGTAGEWGVASLGRVQANLASTGYPESRLRFVEGMVENTVPGNVPKALALLRLDTDWYESTKVALLHFYPRLVSGGVLIIDDYGHYKGQRQAVDEYLDGLDRRPDTGI
jgi:hypothetical protein